MITVNHAPSWRNFSYNIIVAALTISILAKRVTCSSILIVTPMYRLQLGRHFCYYPVRACAAQGQAIGRVCIIICIIICLFVYMWSKITGFSAQKTWPAGVSLDLHASQLVRYSWWVVDQTLLLGILFIRIHTVSPRVHGFYLCALIRSAHSNSL